MKNANNDWKLSLFVVLGIVLMVVVEPFFEALLFGAPFSGELALLLRGLVGLIVGLSVYNLLFRPPNPSGPTENGPV